MLGFNKKTLIGNWYEERWAPEQNAVKYQEERMIREKDQSIATLGPTGTLILPTIKRTYKWDTSGIIADDGFRELNSTNKMEVQNPGDLKAPNYKKKTILSSDNIDKLTRFERPVEGPRSGFGAVLSRHNELANKRFFDTTNQQYYGKPKSQPPRDRFENHAGSTKIKEKSNIQKAELLTGEIYRQSADPQEHTAVQRSWIYTRDVGIEARQAGFLGKEIPKEDNENSLPLGRGTHFNLKPENLKYKHTDITKAPREHMHMVFRSK